MSDLLDRLQNMVDFKHDDMDVAREAIEEIVKLEAQHDEQAATIARLWAKREALQARVAELEEALRPFANVGEFIAKHHPDPETDQNHETATLVRHFRNAHVALEGKKA